MNRYVGDTLITKTTPHRLLASILAIIFGLLGILSLIYSVFIPFSMNEMHIKVLYFGLSLSMAFWFSYMANLFNEINTYIENWEIASLVFGANFKQTYDLVSMYKILEGNDSDDTKKDSN